MPPRPRKNVVPQTNFELKRKLLQLEALYDIGRALNTLRPETELLEEVMHRAIAILDANLGFVLTLDEKLHVQSAHMFEIEVSGDDITYTTVVDKTANTTLGDTSDPFTATARYVRVTVTFASTSGWASFYECKVYGN